MKYYKLYNEISTLDQSTQKNNIIGSNYFNHIFIGERSHEHLMMSINTLSLYQGFLYNIYLYIYISFKTEYFEVEMCHGSILDICSLY